MPIVTISLGVSTVVPVSDYSPEQLLARADQDLYQAKEAGRNQVHSAPLTNATTTADN